MRIEIDTKNDSKEELAHLAKMLLAMSGKPKHKDLFSDDNPSPGLFGMFDQSPEQPSEPAQPEGVFSLFDSQPQEPKKDIVDELKLQPY